MKIIHKIFKTDNSGKLLKKEYFKAGKIHELFLIVEFKDQNFFVPL